MKSEDVQALVAKYSNQLAELQKKETEVVEQIRILESIQPSKKLIPPEPPNEGEAPAEPTYEEVMPKDKYTCETMTEAQHNKIVDTCCKKMDKILANA